MRFCLTFQVIKLKIREVKYLGQGHIVNQWESWDLTQLSHPKGQELKHSTQNGSLCIVSREQFLSKNYPLHLKNKRSKVNLEPFPIIHTTANSKSLN